MLAEQNPYITVALRKESVDRNAGQFGVSRLPTVVALRKESVDRNNIEAYALYEDVKSLSARRAWIEMLNSITYADPLQWSLSARRAWIEISYIQILQSSALVALRKESVDRNCRYPARCVVLLSSLSARRAWIEILSRDADGAYLVSLSARRAWIEIPDRTCFRQRCILSLSARRAWIEIMSIVARSALYWVALRKESVDRNRLLSIVRYGQPVALRKESVDRNRFYKKARTICPCRSPQGERG